MADDAARGRAPRPTASKRPTSYDVAARAGVSQSAVSRAYTDSSGVSAALRRRILAIADELGYRPNAIAQGLITRRSHLIGLIIPSFVNFYYPEVITELNAEIGRRGARLLLFSVDTEDQMSGAVEQLWRFRVDGVIAATGLHADSLRELQDHGTAIVFYNREPSIALGAAVMVDHADAETRLVNGLWSAGARRFAVVQGPVNSAVSRARGEGILQTLSGLGATDVRCADGDFRYESGVAAGVFLLADGARYDAVVCANDAMALGVMDAARGKLGLRIPEDLSVTGFDGFGVGRWLAYELTTMRQPLGRMVTACVEMLYVRIESGEAFEEVQG